MKKNDIIKVKLNNVYVEAVIIDAVSTYHNIMEQLVTVYLCYGQNKLFTIDEIYHFTNNSTYKNLKIVCDHAIIPKIDNAIKHYFNN